MRLAKPIDRRAGAVVLEAAVVYPVLLFLLLAMIVGGLGVFRYQQVALFAREAARFASVHGEGWRQESGQPSPTRQQIADGIVVPLAVGMDTRLLSVQVQWIDPVNGKVEDWDQSVKAVTTLTPSDRPLTNKVRVTVRYQWFPEVFLAGPIVLTGISEVPMAN